MILRVGLTGNIGSGKSTVASQLDGPGFLVIDADRLGHRLLDEDVEVQDQLVAAFGNDVLDSAGRIQRPSLGRLVFADPKARATLEAIVHPRIRDAEEARVAAWGIVSGVAVTEAALLVETGSFRRYDRLVVVDAPPDVRLGRLVARGLDSDDARRRMAAQLPDADKRAPADYVVDNSAGLDATRDQVIELRESLLADLDRVDSGLTLRSRPR